MAAAALLLLLAPPVLCQSPLDWSLDRLPFEASIEYLEKEEDNAASSDLVQCLQNNNILSAYNGRSPQSQATLDLFRGSWLTKLPSLPGKQISTGWVSLHDDARLKWGLVNLVQGKLQGKRVLELGPLEAAHTMMMHQMGASHITSVEGNAMMYLKDLMVKEEYGLHNAHFKYGDVQAFVREEMQPYDLITAAGILYHLQEPVELIAKLAKLTNNLYIWTQVYSEKCHDKNQISMLFKNLPPVLKNHAGFQYKLHKHHYTQGQLGAGVFAGGKESTSFWMEEGDLVAAVKFFGFKNVQLREKAGEKCGPNGAQVTLVATK